MGFGKFPNSGLVGFLDSDGCQTRKFFILLRSKHYFCYWKFHHGSMSSNIANLSFQAGAFKWQHRLKRFEIQQRQELIGSAIDTKWRTPAHHLSTMGEPIRIWLYCTLNPPRRCCHLNAPAWELKVAMLKILNICGDRPACLLQPLLTTISISNPVINPGGRKFGFTKIRKFTIPKIYFSNHNYRSISVPVSVSVSELAPILSIIIPIKIKYLKISRTNFSLTASCAFQNTDVSECTVLKTPIQPIRLNHFPVSSNYECVRDLQIATQVLSVSV